MNWENKTALVRLGRCTDRVGCLRCLQVTLTLFYVFAYHVRCIKPQYCVCDPELYCLKIDSLYLLACIDTGVVSVSFWLLSLLIRSSVDVIFLQICVQLRGLVQEYLVIILGYCPFICMKHMLWLLIRSASPRRFWWVPTTCVLCRSGENYPRFIIKYSSFTSALHLIQF